MAANHKMNGQSPCENCRNEAYKNVVSDCGWLSGPIFVCQHGLKLSILIHFLSFLPLQGKIKFVPYMEEIGKATSALWLVPDRLSKLSKLPTMAGRNNESITIMSTVLRILPERCTKHLMHRHPHSSWNSNIQTSLLKRQYFRLFYTTFKRLSLLYPFLVTTDIFGRFLQTALTK